VTVGLLLLREVLTGSIKFSSSINSSNFSQASLASASTTPDLGTRPSGPIMIDFLGGGNLKECPVVAALVVDLPAFNDQETIEEELFVAAEEELV
jgi:hypothetical protein